jgi:Flp pilus assembly protein TadG
MKVSMNMSMQIVPKVRRLWRTERGSSVIELAVVFPFLLVLFAGVAELGRLFYTYTTLAKATKVGARFLSTQRDVKSTDPLKVAAVKLQAQRLVVCGNATSCTGLDPIVAGLDTANPATNVKVTLPASTDVVKYVKVEIQGYTFQPGVFNLSTGTGNSTATFYFALSPGIQMRYMQ